MEYGTFTSLHTSSDRRNQLAVCSRCGGGTHPRRVSMTAVPAMPSATASCSALFPLPRAQHDTSDAPLPRRPIHTHAPLTAHKLRREICSIRVVIRIIIRMNPWVDLTDWHFPMAKKKIFRRKENHALSPIWRNLKFHVRRRFIFRTGLLVYGTRQSVS